MVNEDGESVVKNIGVYHKVESDNKGFHIDIIDTFDTIDTIDAFDTSDIDTTDIDTSTSVSDPSSLRG